MPFIVPFIPLIAAGVTAGTQIGLTLSGAGQPGSAKMPTGPTALTSAQNAAQQAAVSSQLPNLQSMTGGSLSPEYAAQFGATQSGLANDPQATGNIQAAINKFFGLTAPGETGLTPGSSASSGGGIMDFIKNPATITPHASPGWIDQTLQGNDFKGLVA